MCRITRHRNAPLEAGTADREIAQSALHERDDFVAPRLRTDQLRLFFVKFQQFVLELRELEEIIFFADRLRRISADRAGCSWAAFRHIELVRDAVLPGVL